eukprot:6276769-Alexandrium_andersonii.AAC.1
MTRSGASWLPTAACRRPRRPMHPHPAGRRPGGPPQPPQHPGRMPGARSPRPRGGRRALSGGL